MAEKSTERVRQWREMNQERTRELSRKSSAAYRERHKNDPEFIETAFPKLEGPKLISRIDIDSFNVDRAEKVGDIMQVKVTNIRDDGAFVQGYNGHR